MIFQFTERIHPMHTMQPLLLYKAQVIKYSYRRILLLFVPITLISTPLGQLVSEYVPTKVVQAVAGVLVTFVATWEIWNKRSWFASFCAKKNKEKEEVNKVGCNADNNDGEKTADEEKGVSETAKESEKNNDLELKEERQEDKQPNNEEEGKVDEFNDHPNDKKSVIIQATTEAPPTRPRMSVAQSIYGGFSSFASSRNVPSQSDELKIGCNKASLITLIAGGTSGFLGGMVAIRGPPLIFYFLHPPHPVSFNKNSQRATGVVIMFTNVVMRQIFYLVETFRPDSTKIGYEKDDWPLYLSVIICSVIGGLVGSKMFEFVKDSKDTIRGILAVFLILCGVSLLFSAFRK